MRCLLVRGQGNNGMFEWEEVRKKEIGWKEVGEK